MPIVRRTLANKNKHNMDNTLNQTLVGDKSQDSTLDTFRFTREGNVPDTSQQHAIVANDHFSVVADPVTHDIAAFCARPERITSLTWTGPGEPGAQLYDTFAAQRLRQTTIFEKLKGFLAFDATFCFRVVVNAQPTQVGGLIMSFYPGEKRIINEGASDVVFYNSQFELPRLTGMPSAILNLAATSEAEIRVAYKGENPLLLIKDGEAGRFRLNVYSPLLGATNNEKVNISIYMWLENLKTYSTTPYIPPAAVLQGMTSEKEAKQGGVFSKGLDLFSNMAGIASAIPTISAYAMPVSWLAKGAAGIARWFGLSKPADTRPSKAFTNNPFKDFAHGAGVLSNQTKLTINDNQEIAVRPLGPTHEDEMSIAFLMKRPTYFAQFSWATNAAESTPLITIPCDPASLCQVINAPNGAFTANTTISYLASLFEYWRGDLLFTFTVFGSKFHSGRLRIIYVPGNDTNLQGVLSQLQYTYSHIIDIRDANTFTIKVPYMSVVPFRQTSEMNGTLYVIVENPLIAHPTTSQTINIVCTVAGENFAFSGPTQVVRVQPITGYDVKNPAPAAVLQGFSTAPANDTPHVVNITNVDSEVDAISAFEHAIGDPVISLRTLAKRMTRNSGYYGKLDANSSIMIQTNSLAKTRASALDPVDCDYIDRIAALYKFRAGGMRFVLTGNFPPNMSYMLTPNTYTHLAGDFARGVINSGSLQVIVTTPEKYYTNQNFVTIPYANALSGALQIETPFYYTKPMIENGRVLTPSVTQASVNGLSQAVVPLFVITSPLPADTYDVQLYRAGADDFNCGYFTGPPITALTGGLNPS